MNNTEQIENLAKNVIKSSGLKHIAIIMDGNRRWAKERHLPSALGHKEGVNALKKTLKTADNLGIKYLTVYAFSTENWKRTPDEVKFLMDLLANTLSNELNEMHENNVIINFIGDISQLNSNLQNILNHAVEKTKNNTGVTLQIAFNYGARAEILNTCKLIANKIHTGAITTDEITEEYFSAQLYTSKIPDPDMLIRTGGELRISNFLLWQIAYSEIYITDAFWPDFNENTFYNAIIEFGNRNRRLGK